MGNTDVFLVYKNKSYCLSTVCSTEHRPVFEPLGVCNFHRMMDQNEEQIKYITTLADYIKGEIHCSKPTQTNPKLDQRGTS